MNDASLRARGPQPLRPHGSSSLPWTAELTNAHRSPTRLLKLVLAPTVGAGAQAKRSGAPLDERLLAAAVRRLARAEPRFARIVAAHGPPPLWPREPGFQTLVLLMLEQQVSLAQARAMYARIVSAAGRVTPAAIARLGEAGLRSIGVTRQKAAYLTALATQLQLGQVDLAAIDALPDAEAAAALDALHGVGPWTAQCYLLFALKRRDVFPAADLALLEATRQLWRLRLRPTPAALTRRAEAWRPHRAAAARLLWHHYLSERGRS